MTPEQQKQMRDDFEDAFKGLVFNPRIDFPELYAYNYIQSVWEGFQAAYTPKPDIREVCIAYNSVLLNQPETERNQLDAMQAAIDAIFRKENVC
jgi:hypothetical protein